MISFQNPLLQKGFSTGLLSFRRYFLLESFLLGGTSYQNPPCQNPLFQKGFLIRIISLQRISHRILSFRFDFLLESSLLEWISEGTSYQIESFLLERTSQQNPVFQKGFPSRILSPRRDFLLESPFLFDGISYQNPFQKGFPIRILSF